MKESFAPSIVLPDGRTIYPPGWMYVFAYAVNGFKWAEEEVTKPEFDASVRSWFKDREIYLLEEEKTEEEKKLAEITAQIEALKKSKGETQP